MLYVGVSCFIVRGCAVSRRYIDVCNYDMFSGGIYYRIMLVLLLFMHLLVVD